MIGRILSHYEITDMLGIGGMGEVYLARDLNLKRPVALKMLPADLAEEPTRLRRLQREATALAALDHPNIVTVYSVEEAEGVTFLTMAYVEGNTLADLIPAEGMPLEQLFDFATAIADALCTAHENGIIHRDLKPTNMMVDASGRLRVLDFGLARAVETADAPSDVTTRQRDEPITKQGHVIGTMPYMSPEQAEGRRLDARSDLFSFGVVLYEMATGSRPFHGDTAASLISSILRDEPPSVTNIRPQVPEAMSEIIASCLAKSPTARVPSARVVSDQLKASWRELASGSGPRKTTKVAGIAVPMWVWGAIAAVAVVAALLTAVFWQRAVGMAVFPAAAESAHSSLPATQSIAVLPLRNLSGDPNQEYFSDGVTEALITSLSHIGALRVTARSSAMRFKGTNTPPREVGSTLGVGLIVEGSIMREEGRVRISAQLIDANAEQVVWSEQYDRGSESILALQSEVAGAIARQINVVLTPAESERLASSPDYDPAAYDAYLNGLFHLYRFTPTDFDTAMGYFEQSIGIDPEFALGYVGVGLVWGYRQQFGLTPPTEAEPKMRAALEKALDLDNNLAEAHGAMAVYWCWSQWNWERAEASFRRALELNPNLAQTLAFYSHFLNIVGRPDEAMAQIGRALELDPLNAFFQGLYAVDLAYVGRWDDVIELCERVLRTAPNLDLAEGPLIIAYYSLGDLENCYRLQRHFYEKIGFSEGLQALTEGYDEGGFVIAMHRATEAAMRSPKVRGLRVALFAGDIDEALDILEQMYEEHDPSLPYLRDAWEEKVLGDEPRYQALVRKMNFPPVHAQPGSSEAR